MPTTFNHVSAEDVETDLESNIRDLIEQLPSEGENLTEVREFADFEEVAIENIGYNNDEQEEMFLKLIVAAVREEDVKVFFAQAVMALDNLV